MTSGAAVEIAERPVKDIAAGELAEMPTAQDAVRELAERRAIHVAAPVWHGLQCWMQSFDRAKRGQEASERLTPLAIQDPT